MTERAAAYQLEIRGQEQVIAMLEESGQQTRPLMLSAMAEASALVLTTAVTRYLSGPPGLNRRTGLLASRMDHEVRETPEGVEGTVFNNAEYAPHQEMPDEGPGVMVIRPKTKKVLAFVTSGTRPETREGWKAARAEGRVVFAHQVMLRRHAFLQPSLEDQYPAIVELFDGKLTRLVGGG